MLRIYEKARPFLDLPRKSWYCETQKASEVLGVQKPDNRNQFKWGVTALIVIFISVLLVVIFTNLPGFFELLNSVGKIISPIVTGIVIAFLLNPLVKFVDKRLEPLLRKKNMKPETARKLSRAVGVVFALVFAALILYAFFAMLLPQLYESIKSIVDNSSDYYHKAETWVYNIMKDNPEIQQYVNTAFEKVYEFIENWLETTFFRDVSKLLSTVTSSVVAVVKGTANFVIGFVASIYMLLSKEKFQSQTKKLIAAILPPQKANHLLYIGSETYRVFNGFVIGRIIDSAIIGVICYLGLAVMKIPYAALLATIVGVTNVVPVFGPIIGMIPGVLILLLIKPLHALSFLIFDIILQQFDGNVLGPKILGGTVGISGFWVLISITVFSSLFGFVGMLIGVPVFAIIYMLVDDAVVQSLEKKKLSTDTADYYDVTDIRTLTVSDEKTSEPVPEEPQAEEQTIQ